MMALPPTAIADRAHGGQRDSQTPQKAELPLLKFQHGGFLFVTD